MRFVIAPRSVSILYPSMKKFNYGLYCHFHNLGILADLTVHKLFATRADLYRTVYVHPKVKV